jgi:hypothetical protein
VVEDRDVFGEFERLVERNEERRNRDRDARRARGDRGGRDERRGQIAVFARMVFGHDDRRKGVAVRERRHVEHGFVQVAGRRPECR